MDIYLVKNEKAGSFDDALCKEIRDYALGEVIEVNFDDLDTIATGARVIAAGGDGTISHVAGYAAENNCELGVIPLGTGNDFARSQGILDVDDPAHLATTGTDIKEVDLGYVNNIAFLNHVSVGISTSANEAADGKIKETLGAASYAVGAVIAAVKEEPMQVKVTCDDKVVFEGPLWQVTIANTGHFGGGANFEADSADGCFDVYIFEATMKLDFFKRAWGLFVSDLREQEGVVTHRAKKVVVEKAAGITMNVDGDIHEVEHTITCEMSDKPLRIVVPVA